MGRKTRSELSPADNTQDTYDKIKRNVFGFINGTTRCDYIHQDNPKYTHTYVYDEIKHDILTKVNRLFRINRFKEQMPDQDGLYGKQLMPPDVANIIWYTSFLCILSTIYAIYRKQYDIAVVLMAVWATSINYWKAPKYNWRRNIDMTVVGISFSWVLYRIRGSQYEYLAYALFLLVTLSYLLGWVVRNTSIWLSTICHACIHIFSNMIAVVLCSGYVRPIPFI